MTLIFRNFAEFTNTSNFFVFYVHNHIIHKYSCISSLPIFKPSIYLPVSLHLLKSLTTVLNRYKNSEHCCPVPSLKGKAFKIPLLSILYATSSYRYFLLNQASYLLFLVCILILKSELDTSISGSPVISKINDK